MFLTNEGGNEVWLNGQQSNPTAVFSDTLQRLGNSFSNHVALGDLESWLSGIADEASPEWAETIHYELDILDVDSFVVVTMDEAMMRIQQRVQSRVFLPAVARP